MFNILRKLKRSLVDSGSSGRPVSTGAERYLLYAIGEIALVVIGILIALQINNWNEARNREEAEIILIEQLINDLGKDAESLETVIPLLIVKTDVIKQIFFETQGSMSFNKSTNYGDLTWQAFAPLFFEQRHQRSLDQISNAQLSKSILDYFNQQKIVEFQIEQGNDYIRNTVRPFLGERGIMNTRYIVSTDSYVEIKSNKSNFIKYEELNKIYGSLEFESIIFELRMTFVATAHQAKLLLDANKKLTEELANYVNQYGNVD